ncbi:MAG TPA: aminotransferase class III-fold pyridoxal phosphate-dependent enzyme, partial [Deltaproteobacteria bacterium]|nr:aminotransferase class III-fold pyridoxal phosphate-dependent enzyme [Deltaproteobacteria bacterium]
RAFMARHGHEVAAVIVEPVAGNMNVVLPCDGFLDSLRTETQSHGALLIFDEVITGFRFHYGGYQDLVGVKPDLTCLGKIIGGGLPVGAFGGRADVMALLAPDGPVYQAGTLSGNPLAMAAGLATLDVLRQTDPYPVLSTALKGLLDCLAAEAGQRGIPVSVNHIGPMAGVFFNPGPVNSFAAVMASDAQRYARFFHAMLASGVYLAPSPYEALFISSAHGAAEMDKATDAVRTALAGL